MTNDDTINYYRRRERQELHWAAIARDPQIARIHLDLAAHYEQKIMQAPAVARLEIPQPRLHQG